VALTTNTYTYTSGPQNFLVSFSLGFIKRADVKVWVNGQLDGAGDPVYSAFDWIDDSTITVTDPLVSGDSVTILRTVPKTELEVSFKDGADITPENLDLSAKQGLMVYQELIDGRIEGAENPSDAADRATASAADAQTSEDNAEASAIAANLSEIEAANSEANAGTSESNAAASAAAALVSENNAADSETNAATSETNAAASESAAASSESNAASSESNASTSETNAAASEAAAAASYDAFDDRYLGAKGVVPTLDNDGDALTTGALYFNTSTDTMMVWTGSLWVVAMSVVDGTGKTTFHDDIIIENDSAYIELHDANESHGANIEAAVKCFDADGVEVGHVGFASQSFMRVQSNVGPVWFEADNDSLSAVEPDYPFKWYCRNTDLAGLSNDGEFYSKRIRLTGTGDVSVTSTGHAFQIGADTGNNMALDGNEVQARSNGVGANLILNQGGGNVYLGDRDSTTTITGRLLLAAGELSDLPFHFEGDTNTGIYRASSNILAIVGGGAIRARFDATGTSTTNGQTVMTREKGDARFARQASTTGSVDTYGFFRHKNLNTDLSKGVAYAGSNLRWAGVSTSNISWYTLLEESTNTAPSGTWECLSDVESVGSAYCVGLFYRTS